MSGGLSLAIELRQVHDLSKDLRIARLIFWTIKIVVAIRLRVPVLLLTVHKGLLSALDRLLVFKLRDEVWVMVPRALHTYLLGHFEHVTQIDFLSLSNVKLASFLELNLSVGHLFNLGASRNFLPLTSHSRGDQFLAAVNRTVLASSRSLQIRNL